jgi:hypothetical protein
MSLSSRQSVIIALIVASAYFMENLDATVIATALRHMAATFGVTSVSLSIGMTAYLLALAVFIPISGWVADRFGQRSVFGGAIIVFTGASILCGLSNGLVEFTVSRILQGIGGAMMMPVGRLAVLRSTEKRYLMRSIVKLRIADRDMSGDAFGRPKSRKDAKRRGEFELAMLPFIVEAAEYRWLRQASADWFGSLQLADFRVAHDILLRAGRRLDFRRHRGHRPSTICHKIASCAHNVRRRPDLGVRICKDDVCLATLSSGR